MQLLVQHLVGKLLAQARSCCLNRKYLSVNSWFLVLPVMVLSSTASSNGYKNKNKFKFFAIDHHYPP